MIAIKESNAIQSRNEQEKTEAFNLMHLMETRWPTRVTHVARAIAEERHFNVEVVLPTPKDLLKLSTYLRKVTSFDVTTHGFRRAIILVQARLAVYNKCRPGELESLK